MNPDTFIYLMVNAIRIGLAIHLMSVFLEKKRGIYFFIIAGTVYWAANSYVYLMVRINWMNLITNLIGLCLIAILCYDGTSKNKILILFLDAVVGIGTENLAMVVLGRDSSHIETYSNYMSLFIFLIVTIILDRFIKAYKGTDLSYASTVALVIVSIGIFLVSYLITSEINVLSIKLSLLILMLVNIAIFFLFDELRRNYIDKHETELYKIQSEMYKQQIDVLRHSDESNRILRHDIKHHMLILNDYAHSDSNNKILQYLNSMSYSLEVNDKKIDTGNEIINSVLNYYSVKLESNFGNMDIDVILSEDMDFDAADINILLSNLLSNAYEASVKTEKPWIKVFIRYNRGILNIAVSNQYVGQTKRFNGRLLTTKTDVDKHGIGLISVRRIVEKYSGYINIDDVNNEFCVKILLYAY